MGLLLVEEEQRVLQALKEEEEEVVAKLQESSTTLERQSHALERLLLQLEDRNQHTPLQMLQVRVDRTPAGLACRPGRERERSQHTCSPGG